jgi:hypothetical protein
MAELRFAQLNIGWNAEPNAPAPQVLGRGSDLLLEFFVNSMRFPMFKDDEKGILRFEGVSKYRLGPTNDEGWYRGQCRYSGLAPKWGEFYEVTGADGQRDAPVDWHVMNEGEGVKSRHFLFYFRDNTFEAVARDWLFAAAEDNALLRLSRGEHS